MDCAGEDKQERCNRQRLLDLYASGTRDFHGWQLSGEDLSGCEFSGCNFRDANFAGSVLTDCNFEGSDLSQSDLSMAKLSRANFRNANLSRACLSHAEAIGTDMRHIQARGTNFSGALLLRARFNDADCLGALMSGVNATAAQFESANLECSDFSDAVLMNANMNGVNGSWANMSNARMNWATLSWAKLDAAGFEQSNLTGVSLRGANLSYANLSQTILTGADLYFATLSGAVLPHDIEAARVSSVRLTSQTYTRSQWDVATLREWQQRGAMVLDFEALPREVQVALKKGECNLRIFFTCALDADARVALETLMSLFSQDSHDFRILSESMEQGKKQMAFYAPRHDCVDSFVSALRNKSWHDPMEAQAIVKLYQASDASRDKSLDIIALLDNLAAHIYHIQTLVPIDHDDQTRQIQIRLKPSDNLNEQTQVSWSSVTLPKVSR